MKLEVMVFNEINGCYECVPVGGPHPVTGEPVCIPMEIKGLAGGGGEPIVLNKIDVAEAIQGVDIDGDGDIATVGN